MVLDLIAVGQPANELPATGSSSATPTEDDDTVGGAAAAGGTATRLAAAGRKREELSANSPAGDDVDSVIVAAASVPIKHPEADTASTTVVDTEPIDMAATGGTASTVSGQLADREAQQTASLPATGHGVADAQQTSDAVTAETGAEKIVTDGDCGEVFQASTHSPRLNKNSLTRSAGSPIPSGSEATTLRLSGGPAVTAEQQ